MQSKIDLAKSVIDGFKKRPDIFKEVLSDASGTNASINFLREKAFDAVGKNKETDSIAFDLGLKVALLINDDAVNYFSNRLKKGNEGQAPAGNSDDKSLLQIAQEVYNEQVLGQKAEKKLDHNPFSKTHKRLTSSEPRRGGNVDPKFGVRAANYTDILFIKEGAKLENVQVKGYQKIVSAEVDVVGVLWDKRWSELEGRSAKAIVDGYEDVGVGMNEADELEIRAKQLEQTPQNNEKRKALLKEAEEIRLGAKIVDESVPHRENIGAPLMKGTAPQGTKYGKDKKPIIPDEKQLTVENGALIGRGGEVIFEEGTLFIAKDNTALYFYNEKTNKPTILTFKEVQAVREANKEKSIEPAQKPVVGPHTEKLEKGRLEAQKSGRELE